MDKTNTWKVWANLLSCYGKSWDNRDKWEVLTPFVTAGEFILDINDVTNCIATESFISSNIWHHPRGW